MSDPNDSWSILKKELTDDPVHVGYVGMSAQEIADYFKTANQTSTQKLGSRTLLKWAAAAGRLAKLRRAAQGLDPFAALPVEAQSIADAAYLLLQRADTELDVSDLSQVALINGLVAYGILSADDKTSVMALTVIQVTRLSQLGLGEIHKGDIMYARGEPVEPPTPEEVQP